MCCLVSKITAGFFFIECYFILLSVEWESYPGPIFANWGAVKSFLVHVLNGEIRYVG